MDLVEALDAIYSGRSTADDVENEILEFKRQQKSVADTQHDLADAAVCFANAAGGSVVLGVKDRVPGPEAFAGTDLDPVALRRRIHEVTSPPLDVRIDEVAYKGARLLRIVVQEGLDVHAARGKVPTRRFVDNCLPMTTSDIGRLHDERRGTDWSAVESERCVEDVEPSAMLQVRAYVRNSGSQDLRRLATATDRDLLSALGLVGANGSLNRAGELLLCQDSDGSAVEVLVYQHRQTMGGEADGGRRWSAPLVNAVTEALAHIEARIGTTPINTVSGQQLQIHDYPLLAVREAVANAVTHGDHRERRPVYVEHSPESLEVRSPGPLVSGILPTNILTHPPKPRFPALANAMRMMGLAESWGQGVDRMYREMIRAGKAVPVVSVVEGAEPETSVRLLGGPPNARIAKFVSSLPEQEQNDTDALLVVWMLAQSRTVNARKLADVVQRDVPATQAVLHRLATGEAELLEPTSRTAQRSHPDYRLRASAVAALGPALAYSRRPVVDRDRKIYEHVREYSSINSATIQRLFDVDVYGARNILQELVGREVLIRTSEQRRGTAVRYGAGPKFPTKKRRGN